MNSKINKRHLISLSFIICYLSFSTMFSSCADYDDYNSVPEVSGGDQPGANKTLWENISNDGQLTKFMNLTRQCNFTEVLNSPRFYTIWAPVDDAISETEYNRLMNSDSATIVKQLCSST